MLDVEGRQRLVQPHGRVSNEGVKQAEIVAQVVGCEVLLGSLAICPSRPVPGEPMKFLFDSLLFSQVAAALDQLQVDETRKPHWGRQGG